LTLLSPFVGVSIYEGMLLHWDVGISQVKAFAVGTMDQSLGSFLALSNS
jgi:hypothetical protein